MAGRIGLLEKAKSALDAFLTSRLPFRVVYTVPSTITTTATSSGATESGNTILILDSSFNPPSSAHLSLAISGLRTAEEQRLHRISDTSHRLLLLFSVHNADKTPAPATFEQRLAMMMIFAQDIQHHIAHSADKLPSVTVDIGLTDKPYYNDKSRAIEDVGRYSRGSQHIHLVGFDTFARILEPKYYSSYNPPLSAMAGYFQRHRFHVTLRPEMGEGNIRQQEYFTQLKRGDMEAQGARREWAEQIEVVESEMNSIGVSSTKVRLAVKCSDWATVEAMCTPGVTDWLRKQSVYA